MPVELEIKLNVTDQSVASQLFSDPTVEQYLYGEISETPMLSRYYETFSGAMNAKKWSLRLRREGEKNVASLKTSSRDLTGYVFSRNEYEVFSDTIEQAIPLLVDEGAPAELAEIAKAEQFSEICRIEFLRRSALLKLPDGVLIEMALDKGEIHADGKTEPLHELELELLFGRPEELEPLVELFTKKYRLDRSVLSKYERALRLLRRRA